MHDTKTKEVKYVCFLDLLIFWVLYKYICIYDKPHHASATGLPWFQSPDSRHSK